MEDEEAGGLRSVTAPWKHGRVKALRGFGKAKKGRKISRDLKPRSLVPFEAAIALPLDYPNDKAWRLRVRIEGTNLLRKNILDIQVKEDLSKDIGTFHVFFLGFHC